MGASRARSWPTIGSWKPGAIGRTGMRPIRWPEHRRVTGAPRGRLAAMTGLAALFAFVALLPARGQDPAGSPESRSPGEGLLRAVAAEFRNLATFEAAFVQSQ